VQVTEPDGTEPFLVCDLKLQLTVSTVVPGGCSTVMVALVNATSVMVSVHCLFGQPGAPGIGVTGACVVMLNETFPVLDLCSPGIDWPPVRVTGAGFCPGG
jgi:hypothetical protein